MPKQENKPRISSVDRREGSQNSYESETSKGVTYTVGEVAELVKTYPQYVVSLVNRVDFLNPTLVESGNRTVYAFSQRDVDNIANICYLIAQGESFNDAIELVKLKSVLRAFSVPFLEALSKVADDGGIENLMSVVANSPLMTEEERSVFSAVHVDGLSISAAFKKLNLLTLYNTKRILTSAESKISEHFLLLQKLSKLR